MSLKMMCQSKQRCVASCPICGTGRKVEVPMSLVGLTSVGFICEACGSVVWIRASGKGLIATAVDEANVAKETVVQPEVREGGGAANEGAG